MHIHVLTINCMLRLSERVVCTAWRVWTSPFTTSNTGSVTRSPSALWRVSRTYSCGFLYVFLVHILVTPLSSQISSMHSLPYCCTCRCFAIDTAGYVLTHDDYVFVEDTDTPTIEGVHITSKVHITCATKCSCCILPFETYNNDVIIAALHVNCQLTRTL